MSGRPTAEAVPVAVFEGWEDRGYGLRPLITVTGNLHAGDALYVRQPLPVVPPTQWDADVTQRLRSIVALLGMESVVPDADLTGYEFVVLGMVRREIERLKAAQPAQTKGEVLAVELQGVQERVSKGDGFWHSCSGCHETNEGYSTGLYQYSDVFRCELGNGCSECGGIGAVWDNADYEALNLEMEEESAAAKPAVQQDAVDSEPSAREQKLAKRVNWNTKQWYEHVGAREDERDQIVFCSVMALRAMLVQFQAVTLYAAAVRQDAVLPATLLNIRTALSDAFDTLESQTDSDLEHFECDEDEQEGAPMQYAARKIMQAMQEIDAVIVKREGP